MNSVTVYRLPVCREGREKREAMGALMELRCRWVGGATHGFLQIPEKVLGLVDGTIPRDEWEGLAVTGLYLREYQRRFRRKWQGNIVSLQTLYDDIVDLSARWDTLTVIGAIEAVFSDKMKWVTGDHLSFIQNPSNMSRFVIPAIAAAEDAKRGKGEQAEWVDERQVVGSQQVRL